MTSRTARPWDRELTIDYVGRSCGEVVAEADLKQIRLISLKSYPTWNSNQCPTPKLFQQAIFGIPQNSGQSDLPALILSETSDSQPLLWRAWTPFKPADAADHVDRNSYATYT